MHDISLISLEFLYQWDLELFPRDLGVRRLTNQNRWHNILEPKKGFHEHLLPPFFLFPIISLRTSCPFPKRVLIFCGGAAGMSCAATLSNLMFDQGKKHSWFCGFSEGYRYWYLNMLDLCVVSVMSVARPLGADCPFQKNLDLVFRDLLLLNHGTQYRGESSCNTGNTENMDWEVQFFVGRWKESNLHKYLISLVRSDENRHLQAKIFRRSICRPWHNQI